MKEKSKNEKEIYVFNDEDRELMKMYRLDEERYLEFVRFQDSQYTSLRMVEEIEALNLSNQRIAGDLHTFRSMIEDPFKNFAAMMPAEILGVLNKKEWKDRDDKIRNMKAQTDRARESRKILANRSANSMKRISDLEDLNKSMRGLLVENSDRIATLEAKLLELLEEKSHGSSDSNEKGGVLN